ncbi:MAG: GtrA family protein [Lentisphaeria bacterium]|nr:GtrA family protein [Lentisphaeria bacterium]
MKGLLDFLASKFDILLEVTKSLICGGVSTLVDLLVLTGLVELVDLNSHLAILLGFLSGMAVNYVLNILIVYRHSPVDCHVKAVKQFFIISIFTILIGMGLIYLLTDLVGLHYFLAKVMVTLVVFFLSFVLRKKFIFNNQ